jgi:UDP-N-acetylmuramate: L-alanyl-gamma-D-glutamyl-meso-diaminopimelate ligase
VIEGDEYDSALFDKVPKFVHYAPHYAILTSVEFDHADIYNDIEAVEQAFTQLMRILPADGKLWVCGHDERPVRVAKSTSAKTLLYGLSPRFDLHAENITWQEEGVAFNVFLHGRSVGRFMLPMFGEYNVLNAVAAIGVALELDIPVAEIQRGLAAFRGIRRRQDIYATVGDLVLIDDFAHHPTAIRETTRAIRQRFANRRIWGVFEPRSNTARRHFFQQDLPEAFAACDRVVLCEPFHSDQMAAHERLDVYKVAEALEQKNVYTKICPHADAIAAFITVKARPDDVIVVMSNGGFGGLLPKLSQALQERFLHTPVMLDEMEN